jgi:hypothetical protein
MVTSMNGKSTFFPAAFYEQLFIMSINGPAEDNCHAAMDPIEPIT